jgi:TonB-linked SusC/RagA family outer membrane protein
MYKIYTVLKCGEHSCILPKLFLIMRLSFIFCLISFMHVSATSIAQKINLDKNKASLRETLNDIRRQSGYNIFYDVDLIGNANTVDIHLKDGTVEDALTQIFANQPFDYKLKDKKILIVPKATFPVKGVITDDTKQPLPGVTIRIKGASIGAVADANGRFTINIPDNNTVLVFSMIGFETQEVTVTGNAPLNIVLKQAYNRLDDIIVVGYGTQRKGDLTGSVANIKEKDIQQVKSVSFMEAMQGRMAGVQVTSSSGEPGASVNVTIRGTNSFNAGTQPLYVIDGVQIDVNNGEYAASGVGSTALSNPLSGINPGDIASIEVLKDASATAIFGSRGANGVIVITTKSGKNNTSTVELNTFAGISWTPKHISMLGAQDYAYYRFANNTADDTYAIDLNGDKIFDQVKDLSGVPSRDWQKEVLRKALTQSYNVSYSGGNAKTNFLSSVSYLNQQGLILKNKYERYGLLLKINHNATERLKLGANINLSHAIGTGVASNGGNDIRNYNGFLQMLLLARPVNAPDPNQLALDPDAAIFSNPVDFVNLSYKKSPLTRALTDVSANYRIINGLNLDVRGGAVMTFSKNGEFYPSTVSWGYPTNGLALLNTSNSVNWYQTSTLTWNKRFAKVHSLTALAGFELNSYQLESFRWQGRGFDVQSTNPLDNIATANVLPVPPGTDKQRYVRVSQFARINYSYNDKYLLTATLRNDASSKLAEGNKSALFPSIGIAWRASKENFLKDVESISDLKIRGSFGLTGNERIPPYQSLSTLSAVYYSNSNNSATIGYAPNTIANPLLTWETTHAYDAGIDVSLLKDRITFTADVYLKQTKNLLLQADIPAQSGFMRQFQNLGQIDNKGLELALNTINLKSKNFNWTTAINLSMNRNKVVSLGNVGYIPVTVYGGSITTVGRVIVGQPIDTAYGYVFDGVYQLNDFTIKNSAGTVIPSSAVTSSNFSTLTYTPNTGTTTLTSRVVKPGDLKYRDLNGDGKINDSDKQIISNSNPQHYGGFTNNFTYKDFDLSILFNWSYGNDVLNLGRSRMEGGLSGFANVTQKYWDNRWTPENASNLYPGLVTQSKVDVSSYYVEDASYLRLRNVTFGYNLTKSAALKKAGISSLRVYITGNNLYTWTNYQGFDPEVSSYSPLLSGVDNISYPRERSVILGVNLKF